MPGVPKRDASQLCQQFCPWKQQTQSVRSPAICAIITPISSHLGVLLGGFNTAAGINKDEIVFTTSFCCGWYSESFIGAQIGKSELDQLHLFNNSTDRCVCLGHSYNAVPILFQGIFWQIVASAANLKASVEVSSFAEGQEYGCLCTLNIQRQEKHTVVVLSVFTPEILLWEISWMLEFIRYWPQRSVLRISLWPVT